MPLFRKTEPSPALVLLLATLSAGGCTTASGEEPKLAPLAAASAQLPARSDAVREQNLGVRDTGIFSDLDARVQLALPPDLDVRRVRAALDRARAQLVLYDADQPIKVYPLSGSTRLQVGSVALDLRPGDAAELRAVLRPEQLYVFETAVELPPGDADGDGLPDPLDVLIGARKAVLNADRYDGRYERIVYPGGDVPRTIGVCTDVIIRSLRNAGYDLQRLVHEDILRSPRAYPMVRRPNTDIDHRRVKSLLPYFERTTEVHTAALADPRDPLRPGDVVFMDTFGDRPGSEHVGVIADTRSSQGQPLVINNWTDGTVTKPMDLLSFVPVTKRYRLPARLPDRGPISALRTQLVRVTSDSWQSMRGTLRRYERQPGRAWKPVGDPMRVVLGHAGYGWGDGLHGSGAPDGRSGPIKREGDGRSPAGVFALGTVYGYEENPRGLTLPYAPAGAALRCVDDPSSPQYNEILPEPARPSWRSAERMRRDDDLYEFALVVRHNTDPVVPGHGSCIFVHVWQSADTPVTGCTALDKANLRALLSWLRPNAAVLVALPQSEWTAQQRNWGLP
jgi:D-alanyl-D-alanine dipeptidase